MRIKVNLSTSKNFTLNTNYNNIIQEFIYTNMNDRQLATLLHDVGYKLDNRGFKLFTFSGILNANYNKKLNLFEVPKKFSFLISSGKPDIIMEFTKTAMERPGSALGDICVKIDTVEYFKNESIGELVELITITPVSVTRTIRGGMKQFFTPAGEEFWPIAINNLNSKYELIKGRKIDCNIEDITVIAVNNIRETIVVYNNIPNKSCLFSAVIQLNDRAIELLQTTMDCGIGSSNGIGFGMIDIRNYRKVR